MGPRTALYEPLVAAAALAVGRPGAAGADAHGRNALGGAGPGRAPEVRLGAQRDGALTALSARVYLDNGCFPFELAGFVAYMLGGFYRAPNLDLKGYDVLTFKPSAGRYRAPGAPSVIFAIDTLMDDLAHQLNRDPLELRLQNASRPGDPMADDDPWPGQGFAQVLEALRQHPAWRTRAQARAAGRAVGIAVGGWMGGTEPAAAVCALNRDGMLQVNVGSVDLHGIATSFAMMAADAFGVAPDQVRVVMGDTENAPYSGALRAARRSTLPAQRCWWPPPRRAGRCSPSRPMSWKRPPKIWRSWMARCACAAIPPSRSSWATWLARPCASAGTMRPCLARAAWREDKSAPGFNAQLVELTLDRETGEVTCTGW